MKKQHVVFYEPTSISKNDKQSQSKNDADKDREAKKQSEKLNALVDTSADVLLKASGVFPFDFFPDEIIIDKEKISIITRRFFYSSSIRCIMYKNISEVITESSVLFSTLKIVIKGYLDEIIEVGYLKKAEAIQARRIIQGLINADNQNIDVSKLDTKYLRRKVEKVGQAKESEG